MRNDLYSTHIKFRNQILDNKAIATRYVVPTLSKIRSISPIFTYYKPIKNNIFAWNIHHMLSYLKIHKLFKFQLNI